MSVRDIALPTKMAALPKDRRGYPVPAVVFRDDHGDPHFTINDTAKRIALTRAGACHICGERLGAHKWFVGGPCAALHPKGAYLDGPCHRECGQYALQACPYLSRADGWSRRIDARTIKPGALKPGKTLLTVDQTMHPDQPVVFVFGDCASFRTSGDRYQPDRPWREVRFWRGGQEIASQDAKALIAADPNLPVPFAEIAGVVEMTLWERNARIDALEASMASLAKTQRWTILTQALGLGGLTLLDLFLIWQGGGQWALRDALMIAGLGVLGLFVCANRAAEWRSGRERDRREVEMLRVIVAATGRAADVAG